MRYNIAFLLLVLSFEVYAATDELAHLENQLYISGSQLAAVRADHVAAQQRAVDLEAHLARVGGAVRNAFHTLGQPVPAADRPTTDVLADLVDHVRRVGPGAAVPPSLVAQVDTLLGALGIAPVEPLGLQEKLGLVQRNWAGLTGDLDLVRRQLEDSQRTIGQLTAERDEVRATATGLAGENAAALAGLSFLSPDSRAKPLPAQALRAGEKLQDAEARLEAQLAETEALRRDAGLFSAEKRRIRDEAQAAAEAMAARMAALEARLAAAEAAEAEARRLAATAAAGTAAIEQAAVLQRDLATTREQAAEAQRLAADAQATARQADAEARSAVERERELDATLAQVQLKAAQTPALRGRIAQLQGELDQREAHIATLQAQHDAQAADLRAARGDLAAAQTQAASNGASAQEAVARIAALTADLRAREVAYEKLAAELQEARAQHAAQEEVLNTQLRTVRAQMEDMERDLSSAKRHQNSAQARASAAEARAAEEQSRAAQLDAQYRENERAMQQNHKAQMRDLEAQYAAVSDALAKLEASHAAQDREIAAKQQECQALQAQIEGLRASLGAVSQKDDAQVAKIGALNDHKQALEAEIRQLQDKTAADTRELERLRGVNKRYLEAQRQLADLQIANTTLIAAHQAAAGEVTELSLRLQETQRAHSEKLETLRAEHGNHIARLQAERASKEQEITEVFGSQMARLVAEQKAALAEALKARHYDHGNLVALQARYDQAVAALNAEKQEALRLQAEASKAASDDVEARHIQAMEGLTAELAVKEARITALMDNEKSLKALSAEANEAKDALAGQLAALKGQFEAQVAANAENKNALASLNLRHGIAKRILSKRGNQVQELTQEIAQLKSSLSTTTVQKDSLDGKVAELTAALAEQTRVSRTQADEIASQVAALAGKDAEITSLQANAQQSAERLLAAQKDFATQQQLQAGKHAEALTDLKASQLDELDGLKAKHMAAQASLKAQIDAAVEEKASLKRLYSEQEKAYESAQTDLKAKHGKAIKDLEVQHKALIETLMARLASQGQEYSQQVAALEATFSAKEAALQEELAAAKASASASAAAQAANHAAALEVLREEHAVVVNQLRVENVRLASELNAVSEQLETALAKAADDRRVHGAAIASARATHAQLQQAVTEAQDALKTQSVAHEVARQLDFEKATEAAAQSRSQQATIHALQEKLEAFQAALGSIKAMLITQKKTDGVLYDPEDEDGIIQEGNRADQSLLEETSTDYSTLTPTVVFQEVINYYEALVREAKEAGPVCVGEDLQKSLIAALAMDSGVEEGEAIHAERREGHDSSNLEGKKPVGISLLDNLNAALAMDGGSSVGDGRTEGNSSVYMHGLSRRTLDSEDHPALAPLVSGIAARASVVKSRDLEDALSAALAMDGGASVVSGSPGLKPFGLSGVPASRSPDENVLR
jgi:chromosome segregation ATPase